MKIDAAQCVNKGMQRDYSMDKASQEFAYENRNIRITTSGENSFLSVTNERSTQKISVSPGFPEGFTLLGSCVVGDYWVVFGTTTSEGDEKNPSDDYIYRLSINYYSKEASLHQLYEGNLNFSVKNPIECIPSFEGEEVQKVYWVDGKNQPRVINIISEGYDSGYSFDFNPTINGAIEFNCKKNDSGQGNFTSGVVQYFVTLYNKFLPETNAVYESSLYYICPTNRGGKVNEVQSCDFELTINIKNANFSHIKVYSAIRTSLNSEVDAKVVYDGEIKYVEIDGVKTPETIKVVDTNNGTYIAPTDIFFLGGSTIVASTIEQKNNTLFLGDVTEIKNTLDILERWEKPINPEVDDMTWLDEYVEIIPAYKKAPKKNSGNIYYNYSPALTSKVEDTHFKYLEYYRFGIQIQFNTGEWSRSYFVKDVQCTLPVVETIDENFRNVFGDVEEHSGELNYEDYYYAPVFKIKLDSSFREIFDREDVIGWRMTVVEHTPSTRTIKAQGLVLPSLFNLKERSDKTCFSTPIWNLAPLQHTRHYENIDVSLDQHIKYFSLLDKEAYAPTEDSYYDLVTDIPTVYRPSTDSVNKTNYGDWYLYAVKVVYKADYSNTSYALNWGGIWFYFSLKRSVGGGGEETAEVWTSTYVDFAKTTAAYEEGLCDELVDFTKTKTWKYLRDRDFPLEGHPEITRITDFVGWNPDDFIIRDEERPNMSLLYKAFDGIKEWEGKHARVWDNGYFARNYYYDKEESTINDNQNCYFVDANICNFYSPDLDGITTKNLNLRIIGHADISNTISDYTITVDDNVTAEGYINKEIRYNFNNIISHASKGTPEEQYQIAAFVGATTFPMWEYVYKGDHAEEITRKYRTAWIHYWQHSGNIIPNDFELKTKTFANMWYFGNTNYLTKYIIDGVYNEYINVPTIPLKNVLYSQNDSDYIGIDIFKNKYENTIFLSSSHVWYDKGHVGNDIPKRFAEGLEAYIDWQDVPNIKSVSIKSKASPNYIIDLGNEELFQYILPNYESRDDTGNVIYEKEDRTAIANDIRGLFVGRVTGYTDNESYISDNAIIEACKKYLSFNTEVQLSIKEWYVNEIDYSLFFENYEIVISVVKGIEGYESAGFMFNGEPLIPYNITNTDSEYFITGNQKHCFAWQFYNETYENTTTFFVIELSLHVDSNGNASNVKAQFKEISTNYRFHSNIFNDNYYINTDGWNDAIRNYVAHPIDKITTSLGNYKYPKDKYFWIAELCNEYNPETFMGGKTSSNIQQSVFVPIKGSYSTELIKGSNNNMGYFYHYEGWALEGDTYYDRYDYVRISPIGKEDINRPIDAISIMVETYKNLDGDTRELRGRTDVTLLTPENTNNVLNPIYSQSNNFITSAVLDSKFNIAYLPTMYVWSLNKTSLSNVDSWASINTVNSNLLDADKGKLTKIKNWNDKLIAFQEKGIAIINFNEQTTLSTGNGVPVEIANSGRVSGHHYISTTQGCKNKWSIADSPYGIYFIDSYNKSINVFSNDGIKSLSTINLFQDWILENEYGVVWDPTWNSSGFKSFYDPIHKEVYFTNFNESLCYNELLSQFTSFYDYSCIDSMFAYNGHMYGICCNDLHLMFEGDQDNSYCKLFNTDESYPYSMTYKINKDPFVDKTWTNIEYRADVFSSGNIGDMDSKIELDTFDNIEVWNEYQHGVSTKQPKCKFRVWRADIPRDSGEGRKGLNRIRNPWVMLKLEKTNNTDKRMEFHDLIVKYLQ